MESIRPDLVDGQDRREEVWVSWMYACIVCFISAMYTVHIKVSGLLPRYRQLYRGAMAFEISSCACVDKGVLLVELYFTLLMDGYITVHDDTT